MASRRKREAVAQFGNRIVKTGTVQAGSLLANEANWRIHPGVQQGVLTGLLEQIGFVQGVIVNLRTSEEWPAGQRGVETLVDGHLRAQLALSRGEDTDVPVVYVDLTPDEEATVLSSFDPVGAMASTDHEKLQELLNSVPDDLRALTAVLRAEKKTKKSVTFEATESWRVVVECETEGQRDALIGRLEQEGFSCRVS